LMTDTPAHATATLSLHDALPILDEVGGGGAVPAVAPGARRGRHHVGAGHAAPVFRAVSRWRRRISLMRSGISTVGTWAAGVTTRSEEHTSELQSRENLVCRLLLE